MLFSKYLLESVSKDVVVFYGGRFQPMHKGHHELYKSLVKKFGAKNVFIATKLSKDAEKKHAKGEFGKDPLTFDEKVQVITKMFGVPKEQIVETDPYRPNLELIGRDPKKTSVVLAFSEKDSERLVPGKVMQPYPKDETKLEPLWIGTEEAPASRMYYVTMPVNFSGMSATDFRNILTQHGDNADGKAAFKEFFGQDVDKKVMDLLVKKLNKPVIGSVKINESMGRFLGQGKYHNQVCYILDQDDHNKLTIQFLDGTQLHDVQQSEVKKIVVEKHDVKTIKDGPERIKAKKNVSRHGKKLGSGAYADVYGIDKDIRTVVKISELSRSKWQKDGYYNYLVAIEDLEGNPYVPVIHEIVKVETKKKKPYLLANIEELVPFIHVRDREKWMMIEKAVGKEIPDIVKNNHTAEYVMEQLLSQHVHNQKESIFDYFDKLYKHEMRGDKKYKPVNIKGVVDKQLIEVLDVVAKLIKQGYNEDLHDANFMVRRTPYGPQLVITDPLSGSNYASAPDRSDRTTRWEH